MGIDVYILWNGQTEEEEQAQCTGFSVTHGHVGYLREAYHGEPYATKVLAPECWRDSNEVSIPASTLRQRLPDTLTAAKKRSKDVYHESIEDTSPILQSFKDFVAMYERLEVEGKCPRIHVSA